MCDKIIVLFDDNLFFCKAISSILQDKNIRLVKISHFCELPPLLAGMQPFMLITTDHATSNIIRSRLNNIKRVYPNIHIALFTYYAMADKMVKEMRSLGLVSVVAIKNTLRILDIVIDVLLEGYHIVDSNSVLNNEAKAFYRETALSPMENRVLTMMMHGVSIRNMSKALNIAEKTVMTYKRRSLSKLGAHSLRDCLMPY